MGDKPHYDRAWLGLLIGYFRCDGIANLLAESAFRPLLVSLAMIPPGNKNPRKAGLVATSVVVFLPRFLCFVKPPQRVPVVLVPCQLFPF